ncbi:MAG: GerMN domain-containing protein [Ilumatobacteraceae bacterium]
MVPLSAVVALGAVVLGVSACAIQPDPAPRDIPIDDRALLETVEPAAGQDEGTSRIYLLTSDEDSGERELRSVRRDAGPTPTAVLEELFKGPNQQELEAGLRTAIPEDLVLLSARPIAGNLAVDVSSEILELPGSALRLAVAEIVFTASQLPGIRGVRLRVEGETRGWPDGGGELRETALTVYDYPGLAESSQPPYPAVPGQSGS